MPASIYYDGDCPFCTRYTALVRLREAVGEVELVNVRSNPEALRRLELQGFDLDEGMVFEYQGRRYGGADAMHRITVLSTPVDMLNQMAAVAFGSRLRATVVYPFLRAGRAATLFVLGRTRVRSNDAADLSLFAIFAHIWGLFSLLHLFYYIYYRGYDQLFPTSWAIGVLGAFLAIRPRSPRVFVVLAIAMLVDAWLQTPTYSNHAALRNFVLLALMAAAAHAWLRGRSWSAFMASFAPAGRCMLAIMYLFGVFHKINTDFLDPNVSCAVALWDTMPEPLRRFDALWFRWLCIYGTLVIETLILVGLLTKRFRHHAIIAGILFHSVLALSGYGFYPSFSTLTIALHALFLSPAAAARIMASSLWERAQGESHTRRGVAVIAMWFVLLWLMMTFGNTSSVGLAWLPWALWLAVIVNRYGREGPQEWPVGPILYSRTWGVNLVTALFFFNCVCPYLGLKNAQSLNMFANLVMEGGRSNHLIFTGAPGPFHYLNDVVKPFNTTGNGYLVYIESYGLYVTYYDLLNQLDRSGGATTSFERGGRLFVAQNAVTLHDEIERELHPRWFRNWFLFRPLDLSDPKPCSLSQ